MFISNEADILELVYQDIWRMEVMRAVRSLDLPDCWVAAGFVRSKVWDAMYGIESTELPDIDVIFFDSVDVAEKREKELEVRLNLICAGLKWSVKNQARMHVRNQDEPYLSCADAMSKWPETATAIAVRLEEDDSLKLLAPLGIADLLAGIIRPTPHFMCKLNVFWLRQSSKKWQKIWPKLRYADGEPA